MKPEGHVFQITGLPRSGTAWIASVLNMVEECVCFHELLATEPDWRGRIEKTRQTASFVGDVNTYGFLPKATWPNAAKVFIHRNYEESHAAAEKAFGRKFSKLGFHRGEEIGLKWAEDNGALVIPFSDMFKAHTVRLIMAKVMPWVPSIHPMKLDLACRMNIQRQNCEEFFGSNESEMVDKLL